MSSPPWRWNDDSADARAAGRRARLGRHIRDRPRHGLVLRSGPGWPDLPSGNQTEILYLPLSPLSDGRDAGTWCGLGGIRYNDCALR